MLIAMLAKSFDSSDDVEMIDLTHGNDDTVRACACACSRRQSWSACECHSHAFRFQSRILTFAFPAGLCQGESDTEAELR